MGHQAEEAGSGLWSPDGRTLHPQPCRHAASEQRGHLGATPIPGSLCPKASLLSLQKVQDTCGRSQLDRAEEPQTGDLDTKIRHLELLRVRGSSENSIHFPKFQGQDMTAMFIRRSLGAVASATRMPRPGPHANPEGREVF